MESFIPIFRMVHFVGLAMLLGGTLCSIALIYREKPSENSTRMAWNCIHLIACPGLLFLLITGILQSSAAYWEHFLGAGYMHAKIVVVVVIVALLVVDMKIQKKVMKTKPNQDLLVALIKKRQIIAIINCLLILIIMWLVTYRPF